MTYAVTADDVKIRLGETDTVRSILQNVAIILRTRQGTCPMYREFGLPQDYLDKPTPIAKPLIYAEIREAIEKFEPRCSLIGIKFARSPDSPCGLIPRVEVEIGEEL